RFPRSPGTAKKISMGDPSGLQSILKGAGNMLLSYEFFKYLRPPFSVQSYIIHDSTCFFNCYINHFIIEKKIIKIDKFCVFKIIIEYREESQG
ncbi:MAG: hypothetical protein CVU88_07935, partial [Firmicutes bacterium HGW-Firmicutes-13]